MCWHIAEVGRSWIRGGGFPDDGVSRDVNLQSSPGVVRRVSADGEDSVEICGSRRVLHRAARNSLL